MGSSPTSSWIFLQLVYYKIIGCNPFEAVYGKIPVSPLDLEPLPTIHYFSGDDKKRVKYINKIHEQVWDWILKQTKKYRKQANKNWKSTTFKEADLVWINLWKEFFQVGCYHKLTHRADGPSKVLQISVKMNVNWAFRKLWHFNNFQCLWPNHEEEKQD